MLGCLQREGVDYEETFAPVAKVTTFRLLLALSKVLNLKIHQLDVDSAFPYADLDEEVMWQEAYFTLSESLTSIDELGGRHFLQAHCSHLISPILALLVIMGT